MATIRINQIHFIRKLKEKNVILFTTDDLRKIFRVKSENTLKHLVMRLKKEKIIEALIKGKFFFNYSVTFPSDFAIANYLVIPSYISLESALSYLGLIDQFPYRITSITVRKTRRFIVRQKEYAYSTINHSLFKDFVKIDDFLIASKEKAIFDYCYFIYKGLRPSYMIKDLSKFFKEKSIKDYLLSRSDKAFKKFLLKYVKF